MLPDSKNTERYENNNNMATQSIQRVIDLMYNLSMDEGETHVTCFVHLETKIGIRDSDLTLIHLPTYYSKRYHIYDFFVSGVDKSKIIKQWFVYSCQQV